MSDVLLPSAEVVFIAWAQTHPMLTPLHGGRVGTVLNATRPCLRVTRLGQPQIDRYDDAPSLQVDAWAVAQADADLLARTLIAALPDVRGVRSGARVTGFRVTLGPLWAPDDATTLARYIVDLSLFISPP